MGIVKTDDLVVIYMWDDYVDCAMCGQLTPHTQVGPNYGVPWYCGPCRSDHPEAGGKAVCKPCFDRWERWDREQQRLSQQSSKP